MSEQPPAPVAASPAGVQAAPGIDLNADLGESLSGQPTADDPALLDIVTSANIACGFHAGEPGDLLRTLERAAAAGVTVGAHPSYRDRAGFGRRSLDASPEELEAEVIYQLGALAALAERAGTRVSYVKPHGALYNRIVHDEKQARAVVKAVAAFDRSLPLLLLPGSAAGRLATQCGLSTVTEAFADRAYQPDGTLVPRSRADAVIHDPAEVIERTVRLFTTGRMRAADGTEFELRAQSLCVHGDTLGAVELARALREGLADAGIAVRPFAGLNATPHPQAEPPQAACR